jgi:uncharacterized protein
MKFFLLFGILTCSAFSSEISDTESFAAFVRGDMKNAFPYLSKTCERGNSPLSCDALAGCYYDGDGVDKNLTKSVQLFERACDKNYGPSCYYAAGMYYRGEGVEKSFDHAKKLIERSCSLQFDQACELINKKN